MSIALLPNEPKRDPQSERPALLPDCLRARLWMSGWHFGEDSNCLLWLQHQDGRVKALRLGAQHLDRDELLAGLAERFDDPLDCLVPLGAELCHASSLPCAPIKPRERRHRPLAWESPVPGPCGAFEAGLDKDVLVALACLGRHFVSVSNYNLLVVTPRALRARRFQALAEFPPLVAPVLGLFAITPSIDAALSDMLAEDAPPVSPIHRLARHADSVMQAIDEGAPLVDALARFYQVDRALVRSPLCRETWWNGDVDLVRLQVVNALPPDARPRDYAGLRVGSSASMPVRFRTPTDLKRYGQAFASGWVRTWHRLMKRYDDGLSIELSNARDFLGAALDFTKLHHAPAGLDEGMLGLAWLAVRGPGSLIEASQRWHAQFHMDSAELDASVLPLFNVIEWPTGHARELTTLKALRDEGASMRHCVGSYWRPLLHHATCIAHMETKDGETATAEYACDSVDETQTNAYCLRQLLGPDNTQPSTAMQRLAAELLVALNSPSLREKREMRRAEARHAPTCHDKRMHEFFSQSIDEGTGVILADVVDYCTRQDDWRGLLDAQDPATHVELTCAYEGLDVFDNVMEDQFDDDDDDDDDAFDLS